jgi:hypothetical protein
MNIFNKAKEAAKVKECPGCGKIKPIEEFDKTKNCKNCPKTELFRTMYYRGEKIMRNHEALKIINEKGFFL